MAKLDRSVVGRVFGESAVIILSILLALSADAWLDARKDAAQKDEHLIALARDFDQMSERVNASYDAASRSVQSGQALLQQLQAGTELDPAQTPELLWFVIYYEVFSPSVGAYEALVASGEIELIESDRLKRELSQFFGSFEDMRISERLMLDTHVRFTQSDAFRNLAGWHRMGMRGIPPAGVVPYEQWSQSDEFMSDLGILTVRHMDTLEDYAYLRDRIDNIVAAMAAESSDRK